MESIPGLLKSLKYSLWASGKGCKTSRILRTRARICKRLRNPGFNSKKSIPPAYVACSGPVQAPYLSTESILVEIDSWAPLTFTNSGSGGDMPSIGHERASNNKVTGFFAVLNRRKKPSGLLWFHSDIAFLELFHHMVFYIN